jgi:proline-specific peptidase
MRVLTLAGRRNFDYVSSGRGAQLLLVHPGGPGLSHEYLRPLLRLGGPRRRVVLFHPRGVGSSYRPSRPGAYSVKALADDLEGIRQKFGAERFDLLGFSAGGFAAIEYALRYPSHLRSLLLCGTAASADDLRRANTAMLSKATAAQHRRLREFDRSGKFDSAEYQSLIEEVERPFQTRYLRGRSRDLAASHLSPAVYRAMMTRTGNEFVVDGTLARWDARPKLDSIHAPTLVLVGEEDFLAPASRDIARRIPGARLVVLTRASHLAHLERPTVYRQVLRAFLASVG